MDIITCWVSSKSKKRIKLVVNIRHLDIHFIEFMDGRKTPIVFNRKFIEFRIGLTEFKNWEGIVGIKFSATKFGISYFIWFRDGRRLPCEFEVQYFLFRNFNPRSILTNKLWRQKLWD